MNNNKSSYDYYTKEQQEEVSKHMRRIFKLWSEKSKTQKIK